jgi:hypothetical protein
MPTGYTADVMDGKQTEFNDFALTCARAFGACISLRDEPHSTPIPEEFKPSTYSAERLKEARARLDELRAMTPAQAEAAAVTAFDEGTKAAEKYDADRDEEERRLGAMEEKVRAWEPPTAEHVGLKTFMLEQISISKHGDYRSPRPKKLTGAAWLEAEIKSAMRDVGYHAEEQAKEEERAKGRTAWIAALRTSLQPQQ